MHETYPIYIRSTSVRGSCRLSDYTAYDSPIDLLRDIQSTSSVSSYRVIGEQHDKIGDQSVATDDGVIDVSNYGDITIDSTPFEFVVRYKFILSKSVISRQCMCK